MVLVADGGVVGADGGVGAAVVGEGFGVGDFVGAVLGIVVVLGGAVVLGGVVVLGGAGGSAVVGGSMVVDVAAVVGGSMVVDVVAPLRDDGVLGGDGACCAAAGMLGAINAIDNDAAATPATNSATGRPRADFDERDVMRARIRSGALLLGPSHTRMTDQH